MKINTKVQAGQRIRAFYLFFIIAGMQISVGVLGAPRFIFAHAYQDAWIAILIAFVYMTILLVVMLLILRQYENADIFGIQVDLFGKWIGKLLGTIYVIFFAAEMLSVLLTYTQVVQVFLYPDLPSFIMGLLLLIIIVYCVLGGIRVITGMVFLFVLLSPWVFILLYDPITRMEFGHFHPMFQASIPELLQGARTTSYTFLGLDILLVIYPFIENKKDTKLSAYLGMGFSVFLVLLTTVISIGYLSPYSLEKSDWAVLTLFKSVSLPFVERLDYLVVAEWMMVTTPTMVLLLWAAARGMKRLYDIPQRITVYIIAVISLIVVSFLQYGYKIQRFTDLVAKIGFWIIFVYPLLLLPIVLIKKKWQNHKGSGQK